MTTKEIGDFGEEMACNYLADNDYEILHRNYKIKLGEVDIIAKDDEYTVFIEVKTRKNNKFANASEYVDYRKIQHIKNTALSYIGSSDTAVRFDVIEVYYTHEGDKLKLKSLNHIKDAF